MTRPESESAAIRRIERILFTEPETEGEREAGEERTGRTTRPTGQPGCQPPADPRPESGTPINEQWQHNVDMLNRRIMELEGLEDQLNASIAETLVARRERDRALALLRKAYADAHPEDVPAEVLAALNPEAVGK